MRGKQKLEIETNFSDHFRQFLHLLSIETIEQTANSTTHCTVERTQHNTTQQFWLSFAFLSVD